MTAFVTQFALVGQSFPSETFADLRTASVAARAVRRSSRLSRAVRVWQGSSDPVVLPKRLSA